METRHRGTVHESGPSPVAAAGGGSNDSAGGDIPSGFILKLYQMVNGAPDEVITVSAVLGLECCRSCFSFGRTVRVLLRTLAKRGAVPVSRRVSWSLLQSLLRICSSKEQ